jgi:N-acetylmuramoyl-L-alanine amidase CwlA
MARFVYEYTDTFHQTQFIEIEAKNKWRANKIVKHRIWVGKLSPQVWSNSVSIKRYND